MKSLLLFPPMWIPTQPYLSLPALTGYLKEKNIDVVQKDLSLEFYYWLSKPETLENLYGRFDKQVGKNEEEFEIMQLVKNFLLTNGTEWVDKLRDEEVFFESKLFTYKKSWYTFSHMLKLLNNVYSPQVVKYGDYSVGHRINNMCELLKETREDQDNLMAHYYRDTLKDYDKLLAEVGLVGISVTGEEQLVPSLILAKMIKKINPKVKICFGGSLVSRIRSAIKEHLEFFNYCDYVILFEGETPLYSLCKSLENNSSLDEVPNLIYVDEGEVKSTYIGEGLPMEEIPTPSFEGFNVDKYFSPVPSLPLLTSRGCYWGKCSFCDHSYIYNTNYRGRPVEMILQDIQQLQNEYGLSHISFVDECIPPKIFKNLVAELEKKESKVYWNCELRFEKQFVEEGIFEKAYKAGLRSIFFGLESGCQRVLDMINKGTKVENVKNIVQASAQAGIWNHLFVIFGLPTETKEEFMVTQSFLKKIKDYIHSVGYSRFSLNMYSPMGLNPEKYNIDQLQDLGDIRLSMDFECNSGMSLGEIIEYDNLNTETGYTVSDDYTQFLKLFHRDLWYIYLSRNTIKDLRDIKSIESSSVDNLGNDTLIKLKDFVMYNLDAKGEKVTVYDMMEQKYYELSPLANLIFELLKDKMTVSDLSSRLGAQIDVGSAELQDEVYNFVKALDERKLIIKGKSLNSNAKVS